MNTVRLTLPGSCCAFLALQGTGAGRLATAGTSMLSAESCMRRAWACAWMMFAGWELTTLGEGSGTGGADQGLREDTAGALLGCTAVAGTACLAMLTLMALLSTRAPFSLRAASASLHRQGWSS